MRNIIIIFILIFNSLIFSGSISGYVVDENDSPLLGANIMIANSEIGNTTDESGFFQIIGLDPGKYSLLIRYIGFYDRSIEFYISEKEVNSDESSEYIQKLGLSFSDKTSGILKGDKTSGILKGVDINEISISLMPQLLDYDAIVVSASKKQEKVFDAPATISLVNQRKIREFSGNDIGMALGKVKGMDVYQAGNGRTNINTRGFMAVFNGRFVTLMDGKKFSDPIFRTSFNNTFPTIMEDIDRLEVVFGPSSALYGPNAHNGLINIITKHPRDYPGMDFSITSGSANHNSQRFRYAGSYDKLSFKVNAENTTSTEWDLDRDYAPADFNNDGKYDIEGEPFVDLNGDGMINSEEFYDADHNGVYSPDYYVEEICFLYGCDIDSETGVPTFLLDAVGVTYLEDNIITFERGDEVVNNGVYDEWDFFTDTDSSGNWNEGEPFIDSPNGKFDYKEPFTDCGYNAVGDSLCSTDEGWDDSFGDGYHTGPEGIELFETDFENKLYTRKLLGSVYYQLDDETEITFEPTLIQQKNYVPYDLGYLFIENSYSSFSTKLNKRNFNASLNADFVNGEVITSEELYNAALKIFNGDVISAREMFDGDEFDNSYNVNSYYGNLSGTLNKPFPFLSSLIYGFDFRYDAPKTNRNILRDKGSSQKFVFDQDPLNPYTEIGEDITLLQYGGFTQFSLKLHEEVDVIVASRFDYHSHFDKYYFSPRLALKYSGLKSSNIRLTYNRAHQTPSLFHLYGNIYNQNMVRMWENANGETVSFDPVNLDVYGNFIETPIPVLQPYLPLFSGNSDGFTLDDSIHIAPLEVEIVDSYEIGIKGMPMKNLFVDFNAYYSKFHNMTSTTQYIQTIYHHQQVPFNMNQLTHIGDEEMDRRDILFSYVNLGEVEYLGMDISFEYQLNYRSSIFTTYSYYNTIELTNSQNETPYVGNDWSWADMIQDNIDVSPYDIMHFNAPNEKVSFGYSVDDFILSGLYFEISGKFNSQFDFESGGWNYSEDDQNESYLYSGCG